MEAQVHPLVVATSRFIQLSMPLLPLKPTGQLQRGVIRIGAPLFMSPHVVIEPSALRAAKAYAFE
jgi:hypothetical protein